MEPSTVCYREHAHWRLRYWLPGTEHGGEVARAVYELEAHKADTVCAPSDKVCDWCEGAMCACGACVNNSDFCEGCKTKFIPCRRDAHYWFCAATFCSKRCLRTWNRNNLAARRRWHEEEEAKRLPRLAALEAATPSLAAAVDALFTDE